MPSPHPTSGRTLEVGRLEVERWFLRRGLPHLIHGYNAREDVFTRAAPLLTVVFVAELLLGANIEFAWWTNVLAVLGAVVIGLGGLAVVNRLRGRALLQRPDTIGAPELVGFVLVPAVIPLVFGGQIVQASQVLGANVALVAIVYVVTSYGVLPMVRWAAGQAVHQVGDLANLIIRSLPLLLLFSMFLFFNAELWKIMDDLPSVLWWSSVALLVAVGSSFVAFRIPRELEQVGSFATWADVAAAGRAAAPADDPGPFPELVLAADPAAAPAAVPLDRRGRLNVGLVFFVAQATQIVVVTTMIGCFYVLLGLLTIMPSTIAQWTGSADLQQVASWRLAGADMVLSVELLRTAAFIATVSGLQFTVSALTDHTYRAEFLTDIVAEVRQALAVRVGYLARLTGG